MHGSPLTLPLPSAIELAKSAMPEHLFTWLREAAGEPPDLNTIAVAPKRRRALFAERQIDTPALLEALLARDSSIIQIGVATFSKNDKILSDLWSNGDRAIRFAIAANRFRQGFTGLSKAKFNEIVDDEPLVSALLENPSLGPEAISKFLELPKAGEVNPKWLKMASAVIDNPLFRHERKAQGLDLFKFDEDGWKDSLHLDAVWQLTISLPATDESAAFLGVVLPDLKSDTLPLSDFGFDAAKRTGFNEARDAYFAAMMQKWRSPEKLRAVDYFAEIRKRISAAVVGTELDKSKYLADPDPAVRCGVYMGSDEWTIEAVKAALAKDGEMFLEHGAGNAALHTKELGETIPDAIDLIANWERKSFIRDQWTAARNWLISRDPFKYEHLIPFRTAIPEPHADDDIEAKISRLAAEYRNSFSRSRLSTRSDNPLPSEFGRAAIDAASMAATPMFEAMKIIGREIDTLKVQKAEKAKAKDSAWTTIWWSVASAVAVWVWHKVF